MSVIEIRFKDIDPDTGEISQDKKICECENEKMAKWVAYALNLVEAESADPNRTIYTILKLS